MTEIEIEGGLIIKLNDDKTASVIQSPKAKGDVFIPRIVKHKSKKYKITTLSNRAFDHNVIKSITFPDDSEVDTFGEDFLYFTDIKKLQIPAKLKNLVNPCCSGNYELTTIEVSRKNKNFIFYNEQFLLGKSDDKSDTFDILHLARSDIKEAIIPPQIKIVKDCSFYSYKKLKAVIFPDNSETKRIEDSAFYSTPIEKLKISANIEYIGQSNFSNLNNLNDIEVSPENKIFQMKSGHLLVRKSDPNSQFYDHLVYCYKNVEEIIIPSYIKEISCGAFHQCEKLHSLTFQPNSSLEVIDNQSFIYCSNLKNIVFPETVKRIGGQTFSCAESLESIQFLGKYIELDFNCLDSCKRLKVISFPNATEINFIENNSLKGIPEDAKIIVRRDVKLTGPGIENRRNQIIYSNENKTSIDTKHKDEKSDVKESKPKPDSEGKKHKKSQRQDQEIEHHDKEDNDDREKLIQEIERLNNVITDIQNKAKEEQDKLQSEIEQLKKQHSKTKRKAKEDHDSLIKEKEALQNELNDIKQKFKNEKSSDQKEKQSEEIKDKSNNASNILFIDDKEEEFQEVIEKIGEGASSVAFKIIDNRNKRVMCKKVLKAIDEKEKIFKKIQNSIKEFEALQHLHHPSICEALGLNMQEKIKDNDSINNKRTKEQKKEEGTDDYDIEYDESDEEQNKEEKTTIALFIEYLPYKLKEVLEKNMLNNTLKVRVAVEIAFGMSHIHSHNMMHRDLKIENIMLNYAYEAKIIDFDLVHISEEIKDMNQSLTKGIGTLAYMSPEMSNEEEYDNKTDVYSYGIVLYGIFAGRLPKQNLKDKMTNKNPIRFPHSSSSMTKYCIQLIKKCIEFNPKDRPTFDEIIEDMKNNSFCLAEEIDVNIINERYSKLNEIRIRNNHY